MTLKKGFDAFVRMLVFLVTSRNSIEHVRNFELLLRNLLALKIRKIFREANKNNQIKGVAPTNSWTWKTFACRHQLCEFVESYSLSNWQVLYFVQHCYIIQIDHKNTSLG